jgi:4-aminobutyrate aminotransferase
MDWEAGSHASTFGGNPIACEAALTTIRLLEENLMANAATRGKRLTGGLRVLQKTYECMGDVRGKGLMVGVELVKDRETKERAAEWRDELIKWAFQKGLLLLGCGQNTIRFCPALTVTDEEVDVCLTLFEEAIREVAG